mgnify:CR=1 FL=1
MYVPNGTAVHTRCEPRLTSGAVCCADAGYGGCLPTCDWLATGLRTAERVGMLALVLDRRIRLRVHMCVCVCVCVCV